MVSLSRKLFLNFADATFLLSVFMFQSFILNYLIISNNSESSFSYLWFLGDFFCLLFFSFTLYTAFRSHAKEEEKRSRNMYAKELATDTSRSSSRNSNRSSSFRSESGSETQCFTKISKSPLSYMAWLFYSVILVAKIVVIFKSGIQRNLRTDEFFGSQMLKIGVGLGAIIFSLLAEAHHSSYCRLKSDYVKTLSYGMALEILDSVSFLSLLIVHESHLIYPYSFENFILCLSSLNLMLPAVALYKFTLSNFGESYVLPLEILYKLLHLLLVNIPYLSVRLYLWQLYTYSDTSIFIVKNIYSITSLIRSVYPDLSKYFSSSVLPSPSLPLSSLDPKGRAEIIRLNDSPKA